MKTFGSLFTGFGGADVGAKQAGLELAWGLELRPDVAEIANGNLGNHVRVGNLLDEDPYNFDRFADEPMQTIAATHSPDKYRAFIVDGQNASPATGEPTYRIDNEPVFAIPASVGKGLPKALLDRGRIVVMTPRALARFQTFPDWYEFDCTRTLAAYGIGNAVPCEFARRMYAGLIEN